MKLVFISLVSAAVLWISSLWFSATVLGGAAVTYLTLGHPGRRRLRGAFFSTAVLITFLSAGQFAIWILQGQDVQASAHQSLKTFFQLLGLILLADLVSITTRMQDMISLFESILKPLQTTGLSARDFGLTIALVFRFCRLILKDISEIREALRSRSKRTHWRVLLPIVVRKSLLRSMAIETALRARRRTL